jgi:Phosphopantetheine attachment site/Condensation domain
LGLTEIHHISGQPRLFDTVLVYENYPTDPATFSGADGLAITALTNRDYYHYPLTIQAVPGRELDLRVQYRTDIFDEAAIDTVIDRLKQVLSAMTTDPTRPLDGGQLACPVRTSVPKTYAPQVITPIPGCAHDGPASPVEQTLADIYTHVLGLTHVGVDDSFFDLGGDSLTAMQALTAINTALHTHLTLPTLLDHPTITTLTQQLAPHTTPVAEVLAVSPASDL